MKRFLLGLLLIPAVCNAQKVEFSLKGGGSFNDIDAISFNKDYDVQWPTASFAGSFTTTVKLPLGIRAGLYYSTTQVEYTLTHARFPMGETVYSYPLSSIGIIAMERIELMGWRVNVDLGLTGGRCMGNQFKYTREGVETVNKTENKWYTYGAVIGAQYNVYGWLGLGLETQPQIVNMGVKGSNLYLIPVLAKVSFRIKGRYTY
jgi:hypothetical protein